MALKSTIYKAEVQVSDLDRHYYATHALTIARHPSETDERMMVRLYAFLAHAHELLAFGKGLSTDDEPDLWQKDLTGAIELWIDVGLPDDRRLLKACGRSARVVVYSYASSSKVWWDNTGSRVARADALEVYNIDAEVSAQLAALAERTMQLQCTIQDGVMYLSAGERSVEISTTRWK